MKRIIIAVAIVLLILNVFVLDLHAKDAERVGRLLENITSETATAREKAFRDLLATGKDGIIEVSKCLIESSSGPLAQAQAKPQADPKKKAAKGAPERGKIEWRVADEARARDAGARFALHGMAVRVSRPGAEKERKAYVSVLLDVLKSDRPAGVKKFLIEQLQIAGRDDTVPALAACLSDAALAESARQALEANPREDAVTALRKALPKAKGQLRVGIINSLGIRRDRRSVELLIEEIKKNDNAKIRCAALVALGQIGDERARAIIEQAQSADSPMIKRASVSLW